jgi:MoaA/NifB/PqqE/SkfB family radical SAM enzyme
MYAYEEIRWVHLEPTDKCNAACPQCLRNDHGGPVVPSLPLTELRLEDALIIFPPDFVRQLDWIYACGNFGDPAVARDLFDIYEYFRDCNPHLKLGMHSNGGIRDAVFWRRLGRLITPGRGYMRFAIDGLADTNHIYRRNVRWELLMRNVAAFIEAGGNAEWEFLVFRHNEHQVDEARRLADALGFSRFELKMTGRFIDQEKMAYFDSMDVQDRDGTVVGKLERPDKPEHQNQALARLSTLRERYGSLDAYYDVTPIACKVQAQKAIYVSAEGLVFPCCWLGGLVHRGGDRERRPLLAMLDAVGGREQISALHRPIRDILEDRFFQELLPQSWQCDSVADGKLRTCAQVCGGEFQPMNEQSAHARRHYAGFAASPAGSWDD